MAGCLDASWPACVGVHLVFYVITIFAVLGHKGFAWPTLSDFISSFLLYMSYRIGDLSEVHHRQEWMGRVRSASLWNSLHNRSKGTSVVSMTQLRTDLSSYKYSTCPAIHFRNYECREVLEVHLFSLSFVWLGLCSGIFDYRNQYVPICMFPVKRKMTLLM